MVTGLVTCVSRGNERGVPRRGTPPATPEGGGQREELELCRLRRQGREEGGRVWEERVCGVAFHGFRSRSATFTRGYMLRPRWGQEKGAEWDWGTRFPRVPVAKRDLHPRLHAAAPLGPGGRNGMGLGCRFPRVPVAKRDLHPRLHAAAPLGPRERSGMGLGDSLSTGSACRLRRHRSIRGYTRLPRRGQEEIRAPHFKAAMTLGPKREGGGDGQGARF